MNPSNKAFVNALWWNPWMTLYGEWLKALTQKKEESVMRKYIRHPSDIPINFCVSEADVPVPHRVKDVSVGGLCFSSDRPVRRGTAIRIRIPLVLQPPAQTDQPAGFDAEGIVAWCRREAKGYAVGVQFADPSTRFGMRMVEQICHIEHYRADIFQSEGRTLTSEEAAREWIERYAAEFPH